MEKPISASRELQAKWRENLPKAQRIMALASQEFDSTRVGQGPQGSPPMWTELVSSMQREVHQAVEAEGHDPTETDTLEERRGYQWSQKLNPISDGLRHLTRTILDDIGCDGGETIASLALLNLAFQSVRVELRDGGTGEMKLPDTHRIQRALHALSPKHDEIQVLRVRALDAAERCADSTSLPNPVELQRLVESMGEFEELTEESRAKHRDWFSVDRPTMDGVLAQYFLQKIDSRFGHLDPLLVLEEFAEARTSKLSGKPETEGRTGAARALARLCLQCGALDFSQRQGEEFDVATDRVRNVLLAARSRLKKDTQGFQRGARTRTSDSENS